MTTPPKLGILTIHFAAGHEKDVVTSATDHRLALTALDAGMGFQVTLYNLNGKETGTLDVAPGAADALTFLP